MPIYLSPPGSPGGGGSGRDTHIRLIRGSVSGREFSRLESLFSRRRIIEVSKRISAIDRKVSIEFRAKTKGDVLIKVIRVDPQRGAFAHLEVPEDFFDKEGDLQVDLMEHELWHLYIFVKYPQKFKAWRRLLSLSSSMPLMSLERTLCGFLLNAISHCSHYQLLMGEERTGKAIERSISLHLRGWREVIRPETAAGHWQGVYEVDFIMAALPFFLKGRGVDYMTHKAALDDIFVAVGIDREEIEREQQELCAFFKRNFDAVKMLENKRFLELVDRRIARMR